MLPADKMSQGNMDANKQNTSVYVAAYTDDDTLAWPGQGYRSLWLSITGSAKVCAVTLPPVNQIVGEFLFVSSPTIESTCSITVNDAGDETLQAAVTLDTSSDAFVFISDGKRWYCLAAIDAT